MRALVVLVKHAVTAALYVAAAAGPRRYRGRRRAGPGELSTLQAAQLARSTREAELVDLVVAPLTREGRRYGSASAAYRYLRRLGRDEDW